MKGYKVFNKDWTCRDFKFEVGKTYESQGELRVCQNGFHFCEKAVDCFNYYSFNSENKVAEIIAHGEVLTEGDKSCTNKIEIVQEIEWSEVLNIVNFGKNNTGHSNTGNSNTGYSNTGYWNTGDSNTGDYNLTNFSSGAFCTEEPKMLFFNKPSNLTLGDWRNTSAYINLPVELTMEWWESEEECVKSNIRTMPNFDEEMFIEIIKGMEKARKK